jgi:glycosyltransferase involved in cell wall biosynthesis
MKPQNRPRDRAREESDTEDSLVTVVVPTRDRPELLQRALRSIITQSHTALEVVVVDDGSEPPVSLSPEFARDSRVRLVRLDIPDGASGARNRGLAEGHGDFITFLDDDDEFTVDRLGDGLEALKASPPSVAAVASGHAGHVDGRQVYLHFPPSGGDLRIALLREPTLSLPTVLIRKSALDEIGHFDSSLDRYEDWDLWLRLTDKYKVVTLEEIHLHRRLHHSAPASLRLDLYLIMLRRVGPRIRKLPLSSQVRLWAWHVRFLAYRIAEVVLEKLAGEERSWRLKLRRLRRSTRTTRNDQTG